MNAERDEATTITRDLLQRAYEYIRDNYTATPWIEWKPGSRVESPKEQK